MENIRCIARAYGDKPLHRHVVGRARKVVYVVASSRETAGGLQGKVGVGFPINCVYEFQKDLYDKLLDAYESGDSAKLGSLWGQAKTLDIPKQG